MAGAIIVGGELVPVAADVFTWRDHGLRYALPMRSSTRAVLNHWTGSENPPHVLFANLKKRTARGLSVAFAVDQAGAIWQFADAHARCMHGGIANGWSVGIEIINRGSARDLPTRGHMREVRRELIHGRACTYAAFLPAQVQAVIALNQALCAAYKLPLRVPMLRGDVFPSVLPDNVLSAWRGVLGHLHVDPAKTDPGLDLLRQIQARGEALAAPNA